MPGCRPDLQPEGLCLEPGRVWRRAQGPSAAHMPQGRDGAARSGASLNFNTPRGREGIACWGEPCFSELRLFRLCALYVTRAIVLYMIMDVCVLQVCMCVSVCISMCLCVFLAFLA